LTDACDEFYLDLFTVNGRQIRRFTSGITDIPLELGTYHEILWDGRDESGSLVANGVYFYRMVGNINEITVESVGKVVKAK
jgi:flagellar hook assembly protein FlgD